MNTLRLLLASARLEWAQILGSRRWLWTLVPALVFYGLTTWVVTAVIGGTVPLQGMDLAAAGGIQAQYSGLIDFFAGSGAAREQFWLRMSPPVLWGFWLSLWFLPLMTVLSSHAIFAADDERRTLRFIWPKLSAPLWSCGKFVAHALRMGAVIMMAMLLMLLIARIYAPASLLSDCATLVTLGARLAVYSFGFLGLVGAISALMRRTWTALIVSLSALFILWILHFATAISEQATWPYRALRVAAYVSPFTYRQRLFSPWSWDLHLGLAVFAAYGVLGMVISAGCVNRRGV